MHPASEQFLPRAGLAGDQNRRVRRRNTVDALLDKLDLRGVPDDFVRLRQDCGSSDWRTTAIPRTRWHDRIPPAHTSPSIGEALYTTIGISTSLFSLRATYLLLKANIRIAKNIGKE
jgi:hypothetical protein